MEGMMVALYLNKVLGEFFNSNEGDCYNAFSTFVLRALWYVDMDVGVFG